MRDIFLSYLNKFLNLYFLDYPKDAVEDLYEPFLSIKDTLIRDIKVKATKSSIAYLQFNSERSIEKELFSIMQLDTTVEAIFYYRLARAAFLKDHQSPILHYLANLMKMKTHVELYYSTEIGPGFNILHGFDIVVGPRNKIGSNFSIYQGVTIGQRKGPQDKAIIGNNVVVLSGAKVLGNVKIGDNVIIAANAVLIEDAEPNSVYAGVPAKKIKTLST